MTRRRKQLVRWIAGVGLAIGLSANAQGQGGPNRASGQPPGSGGLEAPESSGGRSGRVVDAPFQPVSEGVWRNTSPVFRIGQNFVVTAGTTVRNVVVIGGDATIEGRVDHDVLVVGGSVRLGPAARVGGDLLAIASPVTVADGALVYSDVVIVGGEVIAPSTFSASGEHVVIGTAGVARTVQAMLPWATQGLLLGRLIVPSLPWMWWVIGIAFFVKLMIGLLFERPVRSCMEPLRTRPLSAVLVGLLVCLLVGPALFILIASVVGIVVIPFALCALFLAGLLGKVAVARALGASVIAEDEPSDKLQGARSFAIGFVLICLAYMVPVLGLVTYLFIGVFGLGAATMALFAGLRRENPAKPRPPKPLPTPLVTPPPPPVYPAAGSSSMALSGEKSAAPSVATPLAVDDAGFPPDEVAAARAAAAGSSVAVAGTLLSMPKATFMLRAGAFAIDLIVVLFAASVIIDIDSFREFVLLFLLYHVVLWSMKGTTLGGMVCNLRVIRTDGEPIGVGDATIRALSAILSLVVFGLGAFWILVDPDRQAWHDRFAGTYVISVPKSYR